MSHPSTVYLPGADYAPDSNRTPALAAAIVVHIGLGALLATGLAVRINPPEVEALQVAFLDSAQNKPVESQRLKPHHEAVPIAVAPPDAAAFDFSPVATDAAVTSTQPNTTASSSSEPAAPITVTQVEYLRPPSLVYPPLAKRLREQGTVVLRVLIDEAGRACEIRIHSSSGHARLDSAAEQAVRLAEFKPYQAGGAVRRVYVLIPLEYALRS